MSVSLSLSNDEQKLILNSEYKDKDKAKAAGGIWDRSIRKWTYAFDLNVLDGIKKKFPDIEISDELQAQINLRKHKQENILRMKTAAIENEDINFQVEGLRDKNGKNPLYNYQKHGIQVAYYADGGFLIGDNMGLGKALQVDEKVITKDGLKRIGDISVGDYVANTYGYGSKHGAWSKVTGIYPQGKIPTVVITFSDKNEVVCSLDHLWEVTPYKNKKKGKKTILTTQKIMENLKDTKYVIKNVTHYKKAPLQSISNAVERLENNEDVDVRGYVIAELFEVMGYTAINHGADYYTITKDDRSIKKIEENVVEDCVCIAVDAPNKLFLLEHYIPTHNTIQGLGVSLLKKKKDGYKSCLIVCPASVKHNWKSEIEKFTKEKALVIEGDVTSRFKQWFQKGYYYKIVNFELLARDLFYFGGFNKKGEPMDFRIPGYEDVVKTGFDMIIVDECHYIAGHKNLRTKSIKAMNCKYRLGLTGTPIDGALSGFHSIIEWIRPGLFPYINKFLERYAVFGFWGEIKRYVHVDEFKEKIAPYFLRRLTKNVLKELPPVTHQNVYVELDEAPMRTYKKLAKRTHPLTREEEAIVTIIRCRQFCDDPDILELKDKRNKLDALEELLPEVIGNKENKCIIFTQYKMALTRIRERLGKKYKICELDTGKNRFESTELFNNGDYDIMLMTDAGSVGINLQSANYVINYDQNWSPSVMAQRYCRAWRNGQEKPVIVLNLICKNTVEERVMSAISIKSNFSASVLDEEVDEMSIGNTLSMSEIFNML